MDRPGPKVDWENVMLMAIVGLPTIAIVALPFLSHWTPLEWIGLVGVAAAAALALTGLLFWRRVRLAQNEAAHQQWLIEKGLSADEVERLIRGGATPPSPPKTENQAVEDLAACLSRSGASDEVLEQVFRAVRAADPSARLLLCHAVRGLAGESGDAATDEQILAVVRALCGNRGGEIDGTPPPTVGPGGDAPASERADAQHIRTEPGIVTSRPRG